MPFPGFIPFGSNVVAPPVPGWFMRLYGATSGYAGLKCPAVGPSVDFTLPSADGSANQALVTNASGVLSFASALLLSASSPNYTIQTQGAAHVGLRILGSAAQSADLMQYVPSGVTAGQRARITAAGSFSNNQGDSFALAEAFGAGATAGGSGSTAIGNGANASQSGCVAVGLSSLATFASVAIGSGADTSATTNAFVSGSGSYAINNVYFGKGVVNSTATGYTINGTGGSGTNNAGGTLNLAPGRSTGSATPAVLNLRGTVVGSSGSTAQTLATALQVTNALLLTMTDGVNVDLGQTTGTKWGRAADKQAWWNATPVVQQVLATGAGALVDDVITLLQTLGLCKQS